MDTIYKNGGKVTLAPFGFLILKEIEKDGNVQ